MAGPNIKLDLGQSVKDVQGFAESINLLGRTVQSTFAQIISNIQGFTNTVSGAVGGPASDVVSPSSDQLSRDLIRAKATGARIDSAVAAGHYRVDEPTGNIVASGPSGTRIVETSTGRKSRERFIESAEADLAAASKRQAAATAAGAVAMGGGHPGVAAHPSPGLLLPGQAAALAAMPTSPAAQAATLTLLGAGRNLSDMPKLLRQGNAFDAQQQDAQKVIQNLRSSNEMASQAVAKAIEDSTKQTHEMMRAFKEAINVFSNTQRGTVEHDKAQIELKNAMGALDDTIRENNELVKEGKRMGGGGGGDDDEDSARRSRKMMRMLQMAQAGTALLGGIVTGVQDIRIGQTGLAVPALGQAVAARGGIERMQLLRETEMADMTKAENIVRYGGNVLSPGRSPFMFLGPEGIERSRNMARRQTDLELMLLQQQRNRAVTGASFELAGGALQAAGGVVAGVATGGLSEAMTGATVGGISRMAGAVTGGINQYEQNVATQMEGGSALGRAMGKDYAGKNADINLIKQARTLEFEMKAQQQARALQDAEMQGVVAGRMQTAIQAELDLIQAQKEGVVLVGKYAVGRDEMMGYLDHLGGVKHAQGGTLSPGDMAQAVSRASSPADMMGPIGGTFADQTGAAPAVASPVSRGSIDPARFTGVIRRIESASGRHTLNPKSNAQGPFQYIGIARKQQALDLGVSLAEVTFDVSDDGLRLEDTDHNQRATQLQEQHMQQFRVPGYLKEIEKIRRDGKLSGAAQRFTDVQMASIMHFRGETGLRKYLTQGQDDFVGVQGNPHLLAYASRAQREYDGTMDEVKARAGAVAGAVRDGAPAFAAQQSADRAALLAREQRAASPGGEYSAEAASSGAPAIKRIGMSVFSELEMSAADFARHQNQASNYLGFRRGAGMGETADLIRMGRGGLGDFQTLLGNLGSINKISGGHDNTERLKDVLAAAVAIGFDKSRLAQGFMQTTAGLAQGLNITNISGAADQLAFSARALSLTGEADERSLGRAAKGMQALAAYSVSQEGPQGAVNALQLVGSGAGLTTGLAGLTQMNEVEAYQALQELEKTGTTTNETVRDLMILNKGDVGKVKGMLEARRSGSAMVSAAYGSVFGGTTLQGDIERLRGGDLSQEEYLARAGQVGALLPLGAEGAKQAALMEAARAGAINMETANRDMLAEHVRAGAGKFIDPAARNLQGYVDSLVVDFRRGAVGATGKDKITAYTELIRRGGLGISISEQAAQRAGDPNLAGQMITEDVLTGKSGGRARQAAGMMFNGAQGVDSISMLDVIRMGYESSAGASQAQAVYVTNFGQLVSTLMSEERRMTGGARRKNPNKTGANDGG